MLSEPYPQPISMMPQAGSDARHPQISGTTLTVAIVWDPDKLSPGVGGWTAVSVPMSAFGAILNTLALTDTTTIVWDFSFGVARANIKAGSVVNSLLADMVAARVKGQPLGAVTGPPVDLTPAQLKVIVESGVTTQVVTGAGTVICAAETDAIILNKAAPSVTPITLPTLVSRNGKLLAISDFAGNGGDITITPATGERIHGLTANTPWVIGSGGAGLGGSLRL